MHRLFGDAAGGWGDAAGSWGEAAPIEQTPADLVFLSAQDTDLALLDQALEKLEGAQRGGRNAEFPSIRLAHLSRLKEEAVVDHYSDRVLRHAKVIVASLLGGEAYWPWLVERLCQCAAQGATLILISGDDSWDANLAERGSAAVDEAWLVWRYLRCGGLGNAQALLTLLARRHFALEGPEPQPPTEFPRIAAYDRDLERPLPEGGAAGSPAEGQREDPVAALVFYRAHLQSGNTAALRSFAQILRQEGLDPLPIALASFREEECRPKFAALCRERGAALVINTTGFAISDGSDPDPLGLGVPVFQAMTASCDGERWRASSIGLPPQDIVMNMALPEIDGRIITRAVSFKERQRYSKRTQCDILRYRAAPDRMRFVARLAANWIALGAKKNRDKKIALVLAQYPSKDGRAANGVGLDTPASVIELLRRLRQEGYNLGEIPANGDLLMEQLLATSRLDAASRAWAQPRFKLSAADYARFLPSIPLSRRRQIERRWGDWGQDPSFIPEAADGPGFAINGIVLGSIFIGLQPARGYGIDPIASYHDPALPPPPSYLAFYCWLRQHFAADALVQVGKHGNLEWLPGKGAGLSALCWPEIAFGPMPLLYPFIVNDPGEGMQAKRRSQAVVIDHLTPPLVRAGSYGDQAQLEMMVDEYHQAAQIDPRRSEDILRQLTAKAKATHLFDELEQAKLKEKGLVGALDEELCDLKEAQIRGGLHVFGRRMRPADEQETALAMARLSPSGEGILQCLAQDFSLQEGYDPLQTAADSPWSGARPPLLQAITKSPWRSCGDTRERLEILALKLVASEAEELLADLPLTASFMRRLRAGPQADLEKSPEAELDGLLRGLAGLFVAPGASGAPSRGRWDALPTGRNFYGIDTRSVPTPTAWRLGWRSASELLRRYVQDQGDYPRTLGLSVWGTSTIRTGGDDIAQALALIGARPIWQQDSGRVVDVEILPLSLLDRPRVDVTLRISGFMRDSFAETVALFDRAVRRIMELDEAEEDNPLRAAAERRRAELESAGMEAEEARHRASWRVFGSQPGAYGAGLQALIDERAWRDRSDLARAWIQWGSFVYGGGEEGLSAADELGNRLAAMQTVLHNQDNREHDLLDSDDYYQFQGGMAAAVELMSGRRPAIYHGDNSQPENPRIRSLEQEISRVLRSRALNPKWIRAMQRHGYKGAFEMAATVDYLFAYAASTGAVRGDQFAAVAQTFAHDKQNQEFMKKSNPAALRELSERLLEAIQRGLWSGAGKERKKLEELLLDLDEGLENRTSAGQ